MPQEQNVQQGVIDSAAEPASLIQRITPLARELNCLDIECIGKVCVEKIASLAGARLASVYLLDNDGHMLHLLSHNHGFPIDRLVSLNKKPPSPMVMVAKTKSLVAITDIDHHKWPVIRRSQRANVKNYQTANCVIVPLICQDQIVGVLNLADLPDGNFMPNMNALLELFGQLVGASLGNIHLFERMQKQATTDGLTGMANHRTFYEALEKELWRARRFGGRLSLIMVDIDNLKTINDKLGHRAGDKVILEVAHRMLRCIRQIDTAARYGGDEFAIILPNTSEADALGVAQRMVDKVSERPILWEDTELSLSVSVGVGEYQVDATPEKIMRCSDKALYAAKESGKNTVRVFGSLTPS
jgi:diguanylate cyclase (GGDEF)-like protein